MQTSVEGVDESRGVQGGDEIYLYAGFELCEKKC